MQENGLRLTTLNLASLRLNIPKSPFFFFLSAIPGMYADVASLSFFHRGISSDGADDVTDPDVERSTRGRTSRGGALWAVKSVAFRASGAENTIVRKERQKVSSLETKLHQCHVPGGALTDSRFSQIVVILQQGLTRLVLSAPVTFLDLRLTFTQPPIPVFLLFLIFLKTTVIKGHAFWLLDSLWC